MTEPEAPKIEFPCDYPVKVMGRQGEDFADLVFGIMEKHAPGFDRDRVQHKNSSKGTFTSITVFITATGKPQLEALHAELMATGRVQMVL